jgi:hypothetical protein
MDISAASVAAASSQIAQQRTAQQAEVLVLKKAMDIQEAGALALLQALPPVPQLATEGTLGTQVNTYA